MSYKDNNYPYGSHDDGNRFSSTYGWENRMYPKKEEAGPSLLSPPEKPNKERRAPRGVGLVAGVLAVSLVSGMAGGGLTYYLLDNTGEEAAAQSQTSAPSALGEGASAPSTTTADSGSGTTGDIASIAAKASVSVVEISVEATGYNPFFGEYTSGGSGSGVVVTQDGYIVTNNHVVEGGDTYTVRTSDGEEYTGALVGTDSKTDLAVIKVEASGLTPVTFGDSDALEVGDLAVAIGNSLGTLGGTVTSGIISAKDREITIGDETMTLLQTSAAVNPGNSGGGLFDASGNLVGIVNAKSAGTEVEGLGFAIPSNQVRKVADDIMEHGYVTGRGEIGIRIIEVFDAQTAFMYRLSEYGVYIYETTKDNGLVPGDRVISIGDRQVEESADITAVLADSEVGDVLEFRISRDGEERTVSVPVTEQVPEHMLERVSSSEV